MFGFVQSGPVPGGMNSLNAVNSLNWPLAIVVLENPTGSVAMAGFA
jgi:hypothetical protein